MYRAQHGFAQEHFPKQVHFAPPESFNEEIWPENVPTNIKELFAIAKVGPITKAGNKDIQDDEDWLADFLEDFSGPEGDDSQDDIFSQIDLDH